MVLDAGGATLIELVRVRFASRPAVEAVVNRLRVNTGLDVSVSTPAPDFVVISAPDFDPIESSVLDDEWNFEVRPSNWWSYLEWQLIRALIDVGGKYVAPPSGFPRWLFLPWDEKRRDFPEVRQNWSNTIRKRYNR